MTATTSTAIQHPTQVPPSDGHPRSVDADGAIILTDHYDTAAGSSTSGQSTTAPTNAPTRTV